MSIYLGFESSCDDTGVALYNGATHKLLGYKTISVPATHQPFGGVVPELASRDHLNCVSQITHTLLEEQNLTFPELSGVAYTQGPGLTGSLLVGIVAAKTIAWAHQLPALGIHHLEGHILSPFLNPLKIRSLEFPFVCLLVSGGHTLLSLVQKSGRYDIVGESIDDAAGEVFDKTAKMMGKPYPGGGIIEEMAKKGDATRFHFPRPMLHEKHFNFSFSGLKTAVSRQFEKLDPNDTQVQCDIAASFQKAVIDCLWKKTHALVVEKNIKHVLVCGGVSANLALRNAFESFQDNNVQCYWPDMRFCSDNGAMIALAGTYRMQDKQKDRDWSCQPKARWKINELHSFEIPRFW